MKVHELWQCFAKEAHTGLQTSRHEEDPQSLWALAWAKTDQRLDPTSWPGAFNQPCFSSNHCRSAFDQSFFPCKTLLWPIQQEPGKAEITDMKQASMSQDAATSTHRPAEPDSLPKGTLCFLALFHAVLFKYSENPKHRLMIFSFQ